MYTLVPLDFIFWGISNKSAKRYAFETQELQILYLTGKKDNLSHAYF